MARTRIDEAEVVSRILDRGGVFIRVSRPGSVSYIKEEQETYFEKLRADIPESVIPETSPEGFLREVISSVSSFLAKFCEPLKTERSRGVDYQETAGIYQCSHPKTGRFFAVVDRSDDRLNGYTSLRFLPVKSRLQAEREFRKLVEEMKGGEEWQPYE